MEVVEPLVTPNIPTVQWRWWSPQLAIVGRCQARPGEEVAKIMRVDQKFRFRLISSAFTQSFLTGGMLQYHCCVLVLVRNVVIQINHS